MTMYSHSKLCTFEQCPLKYKYSYVDRIKREKFDTVEAFVGSRVHDTLEKLYKNVMMRKIPELDEVIALYSANWDENWHDGVVINNKDYSAEDYRNRGEFCVDAYYKRYYPFDQAVTLATEQQVSGALDENGRYTIQGYIDRVDQRRDGVYEIHDYKSANRAADQEEADTDRQLALYQLLLRGKWDDATDVELVWHYVGFDKEIRSTRTAEQLEELAQDTIALIDTVETAVAENDLPACESRLCDWCDYWDLCPCKTHLIAVESLPKNEYLGEEGVVLVDKLTELAKTMSELKSQQKAIEEEKGLVEEALIEYAKAHDYEVVNGSECKAKIKTSTKIVIPLSGDARRPEFEELFKEYELWDDVCGFDMGKAKKLIDEGNLSDEALAAFEPYYELLTAISVSLSKLDQ